MRRYRLFSIGAMLCAALASSIAAFTLRGVAFVRELFVTSASSAAAFVWSAIEPALRSSAPLAYDGPSSPHALRHEAGTSRRAADRHI